MYTETQTTEVYRMARKGRPRKAGERENNGRLSRSAVDRGTPEQQAQSARLLGEARYGVEKDDALAILAALGHITNEQAAAGADYGRAHRTLYGRPWVQCGDKPQGRAIDGPDAQKNAERLEAKVRRGETAISKAGGNAVGIMRSICVARILPGWAQFGPVFTLKKVDGKVKWAAAGDRDRQKMRAMKRDLPALKKALDNLIEARFGTNKAMEMAA